MSNKNVERRNRFIGCKRADNGLTGPWPTKTAWGKGQPSFQAVISVASSPCQYKIRQFQEKNYTLYCLYNVRIRMRILF